MSEVQKILFANARMLRVAVMVFIGAIIQVGLIGNAFWYFTVTGAFQDTAKIVWPSIGLGIGYFLLTIIYSMAASLTIRPKTIVSPFWIQAIAVALLVCIATATLIIYQPPLRNDQAVSNIVGNTAVIGLFMMMAGLAQLFIVRELLGLTGTKADTIQQTFTINERFSIVAGKMKDRLFLSKNELLVKVDQKDRLALLSTNSAETTQIFVLTADKKDDNKSVLVSVCYQVLFDTLFKTPTAIKYRDGIIGELVYSLQSKEKDIQIAVEQDDEDLLKLAYYYALKPTRTKLSGLRDIPKRFLVSVGVLAGIGIAFTIANYLTQDQTPQPIGSNVLIGVWIAIIVGVVTQLLPSLKDKTSKPETPPSL